mgnify:CR=1 FL=1
MTTILTVFSGIALLIYACYLLIKPKDHIPNDFRPINPPRGQAKDSPQNKKD